MPLTGAPLREEESFALVLGLRVHLVWSSLLTSRRRSVHLSGLAESFEAVRTMTIFFAGSWPLMD